MSYEDHQEAWKQCESRAFALCFIPDAVATTGMVQVANLDFDRFTWYCEMDDEYREKYE